LQVSYSNRMPSIKDLLEILNDEEMSVFIRGKEGLNFQANDEDGKRYFINCKKVYFKDSEEPVWMWLKGGAMRPKNEKKGKK